MSAQSIYDTAPLGATIKFSDGMPKPPARFTKKVAAWERVNGTGRLIRKSPAWVRGTIASPASITLHEGDLSSAGVVLVTIHRVHNVDSKLRFEVIAIPGPGSCRIVQPHGDSLELLHIAENHAAAEAWLSAHRYSSARIELVEAPLEEVAAA
jgi:hypothetical protein